jgi:DNA-binding NarL/FixJ family response regulator
LGPPGEVPSSIILYANGQEDLSKSIERHREVRPDKLPILVFGPRLDLAHARDALRAGTSGLINAGMIPNPLLRAVAVATKGELVALRELLNYLLSEEEPANFDLLSARQREILGYVVEGLSNAEIARRLFLTESTIKQHLRAAYKLLGVKNRTKAANLFRRSAKKS